MTAALLMTHLSAGLAAAMILAAACRRGDGPQRWAGLGLGFSWPLSQASCPLTAPAGPIVLLVSDAALGLMAAALAWKSPRLWPTLAAAILAVATAAHLIVLIAPPASLAPHAVLTQACRLGASLVLAAAVRPMKTA